MRTSTNSVEFFSQKDYDNLLHKHLSLKDYKMFIKDVNKETGEKHILESREGFTMPVQNLGTIKIVKYYRPKGVFAAHKKTKKEYNIHTMGYVYTCKLFRKGSCMLYYTKVFAKTPPDETERVNFLHRIHNELYIFKTHRMNIKRPLAKILKSSLRDYDEIK